MTKNLFFTPVYAAVITGQPKILFIKELIPGFVMAVLLSMCALMLSRMYNMASIPRLLVIGVSMSVIYALMCYWRAMRKGDRTLLWSLILRGGATK